MKIVIFHEISAFLIKSFIIALFGEVPEWLNGTAC